MSTFTTTLPAADAYGADTKYIAVNAITGEINAPVSAIQITHPKFGLAVRGDWQWALMEPSMAKLLLAGQPAQGATGDSNVQKLLTQMSETAKVLAECGSNLTVASYRLKRGLLAYDNAKMMDDAAKITPGEIISAPGGPFELQKS